AQVAHVPANLSPAPPKRRARFWCESGVKPPERKLAQGDEKQGVSHYPSLSILPPAIFDGSLAQPPDRGKSADPLPQLSWRGEKVLARSTRDTSLRRVRLPYSLFPVILGRSGSGPGVVLIP